VTASTVSGVCAVSVNSCCEPHRRLWELFYRGRQHIQVKAFHTVFQTRECWNLRSKHGRPQGGQNGHLPHPGNWN